MPYHLLANTEYLKRDANTISPKLQPKIVAQPLITVPAVEETLYLKITVLMSRGIKDGKYTVLVKYQVQLK